MVFQSANFLVFFTVVLTVLWLVPSKWRKWWVLGASGYFYWYWGWENLVLLTMASVWVYGWGRLLGNKKLVSRWTLAVGVGGLLGMLAVFKYLNFSIDTVNYLVTRLGWDWSVSKPEIGYTLPLGISFWVFTAVAYLVDVYRKRISPEKSLTSVAVFLGFFPKVMAGPIERAEGMLQQLNSWRKFEYARTVHGAELFAWGLFKKLVIADNIGTVVQRAFAEVGEYKGLALWVLLFMYSWYIYYDFSGYTDMARGIARMLGVELSVNFNNPYRAVSVRDFWRRWHMTLSSWLRDYIYFPLGGSRVDLVRNFLNTFVVFIVCGLWHGAAWNFVMWGAMHGLVLNAERLVGKVWPENWQVPRVMRVGYSFMVVSLLWMFFRLDNMRMTAYVIANLFEGIKNVVRPDYVLATLQQIVEYNRLELAVVGAALVLAMVMEWGVNERKLAQRVRRLPLGVKLIGYVGLASIILLARNVEVYEFIYVRF